MKAQAIQEELTTQATQDELTASELSTTHDREPYVAIGLRGKRKLTLLRASEVTEQDILAPEELLEKFPQESINEQWLKRKVRKLSALIWGGFSLPILSLAGAITIPLSANLIREELAAPTVILIMLMIVFGILGTVGVVGYLLDCGLEGLRRVIMKKLYQNHWRLPVDSLALTDLAMM